MSEHKTPFYTEILQYIQRDVERRRVEEGFDPSYDRNFHDIQTALAREDNVQSLPKIIEQYNYLFNMRGTAHLELKLLESFVEKEFVEMGLAPSFPRIYRGIPRVYSIDNPSISRVKSPFTHLPSLKRCAVAKALYSLYGSYKPQKGKVVLFTWVLSDGLGDWRVSLEIERLLKEAFPQLEIASLHLIPKRWMGKVSPEACFYEGECPISLLEGKHWDLFKGADLVLQTPTYYPHTKELIERVLQETPGVQFQHLGEYGYLESSSFHPQSGNHSMGLHFLERGILTRKIPSNGFDSLQNRQLLQWLFGMENPTAAQIDQYQRSTHFHLAYLCTPFGGKIYLHALLKWLMRDDKPIDICTPDLGWFIGHIEECKEKGELCLDPCLGVKQIEVWQGESVYVEKISEAGKTVRILSSGSLSHEDFQALLAASGEFIAVRGNQSLTEAVSANKIFFYDSGPHNRYFMKDLGAIAESRIGSHRGALECIREMVRGAQAQLPLEEGDWVDEIHFQQIEPFDWKEAAETIGMALSDPDTAAGFKKFNQILAEEFSCNQFLVHLVQRSLQHKQDPVIAYLEEKQLTLFSTMRQSFKSLIQNMRVYLTFKNT